MQTFIQKITSRKLWLAVGAIGATWATPGVSNSLQAILTAVCAAAYAIGEGIADAGKKS
jgi:hypothetical protein